MKFYFRAWNQNNFFKKNAEMLLFIQYPNRSIDNQCAIVSLLILIETVSYGVNTNSIQKTSVFCMFSDSYFINFKCKFYFSAAFVRFQKTY